MTDRQIDKWLRRRLSGICWLLIGYYFLMNTLVYATAAVDALKQILWNLSVGAFPLDIDPDALLSNGWGYVASIAVAFAIVYAWKGKDYWRQEVFHRERPMSGLVFLCAVSLCMGCQMVSTLWMTALEWGMNCFGRSILPMLEYVGGGTSTFSMFLYSALLAPLSEEVLFRGIALRALGPYGKRFAIFGSALLFGLFHGNLLQGPYAFLMGLLLGYLACEYSIHWAIALHVFNNLVLAEGLSWLTDQLPMFLADGLQLILLGGFFVVSLVILAVKRGEIAAYRRSEWIDRRCIKCFLTNPGFLLFAAMMAVNMVAFFA